MLKEKWKITALFVLIFSLSGICICYFYSRENLQAARMYPRAEEIEVMYPATAAIAAALDQTANSAFEPADLYRGHRSQKRQLLLTITGLPDPLRTLKLLDLLDKYQVRATFFVEGLNAAVQQESIRAIQEAGFAVGGYSWIGLNHMEELERKKRIVDFCRTQQVLTALVSQPLDAMMCSKTVYTRELMQDARASGFDSLVKASVYFPWRQLIDEAAAGQYVHSLPQGAIVAITAGMPVDVVKYEPEQVDSRPAIDKQPGVRETIGQSDSVPDNLLDEMERFFAVLQQEKWETLELHEYPREKFEPPAIVKISAAK